MPVTLPLALLIVAVFAWALVLIVVLPLLYAWGGRDKDDREVPRQSWARD